MFKFNSIDVIDIIKNTMEFSGTWPKDNPSLKYKVIGFSTISAMVFVLTTIFLELRSDFTDVDKISFGMACAISIVNSLAKHAIIMFFKKSQFDQVLTILNNAILLERKNDLNLIYAKNMHTYNKLRVVYLVSVLSTGCVIILSPLMDLNNNRRMPVPFPLDMNQQPLLFYVLLFLYQSYGVMATSWTIASFDGLMFTIMGAGVAHLRILNEKILHSTDCIPCKSSDIIINSILKECVIYHMKIGDYIIAIENAFSIEFMIQLLMSLLAACLVVFNLILIPANTVHSLRCLVFFCSIFIELAFYCVPGNEIIYQSDKIRDACYMSNWISCGSSVRKTLTLIMERSKYPFKLTAATFTNLSLQTLLSVLRKAGSYFSVLWQLYSNSEKN